MGEKRKKELKEINKTAPKKAKVLNNEHPTREQKLQILKKMKLQWESLRNKSINKKDRHSLISKLINANSKHIHDYLLTSNMSRILQTLIKHSDNNQRLRLFDIIKDRVNDMFTSKYGKHILLKFLKYGGKPEKDSIFKFMSGKILKLVKHSESSVIVEQFYSEEATNQQKNQMLCEFYGPSFVLNRTSPKENFVDFIKRINDSQKEKMISSLKDIILSLIERQSLQSSIVHKLVNDVISCCVTNNDVINGIKKEMIESLSERLPQIMHTSDGSKVAITCIKEGSLLQHREILTQLKTIVCRAVVDDCAHLAIIALLSHVWDPQLLSTLLVELEQSLEIMFENKYGFRVLEFILSPNDQRLVPASIRNVAGDISLERVNEQFKAIRLKMLEYVESHVSEMATMKNRLWFLVILLTTCDDCDVRSRIFDILAKKAVFDSKDKFVEHPTGHVLLKHLISSGPFAHVLMSYLSGDVLREWIKCNRGCFVIISLLGVDDVIPRLSEMIRPLLPSISKLDCCGGKVLNKCIHDAGF